MINDLYQELKLFIDFEKCYSEKYLEANERKKSLENLKNEIMADVRPSFNAVKNAEAKMAKPANKKENENIKNPRSVSFVSSGSYPTKEWESGDAKISEIINI